MKCAAKSAIEQQFRQQRKGIGHHHPVCWEDRIPVWVTTSQNSDDERPWYLKRQQDPQWPCPVLNQFMMHHRGGRLKLVIVELVELSTCQRDCSWQRFRL